MTQTAKTFQIRKEYSEPLNADRIFCMVRASVGDLGSVVRPSSARRCLYQILTLIRIALVLTFILVAAANIFGDVLTSVQTLLIEETKSDTATR
jgi:hypothetical protein